MPESEQRAYTVTELTQHIKSRIEQMGRVWLTGEISGYTSHSSGHAYLTLKDEENQISALIWRNTAKNLDFALRNGQQVLVSADMAIYGPQSKYQVIIQTIELRGSGALQVAFEKLKQRLKKEGLFSVERKRKLPYLPRKIAVVTSPTGAAVKDILNVIDRRYPHVEIYVIPVRVQGEGSAEQVAAAIRFVNSEPQLNIDVMIVGRGGGSPEDLWAFNEEPVAYAIFESKIPVISAVGHEVDFTISDLVADKRALTPTEAGELVLPRFDLLKDQLRYLENRLKKAMDNRLEKARAHVMRLGSHRALTKPMERVRYSEQRLHMLFQKMKSLCERNVSRKQHQLTKMHGQLMAKEPSKKIDFYAQRFKEFSGRIERAMHKRCEWEQRRLQNLTGHLEALSPLSVISRGYSITYNQGGKILQDAEDVKVGEHMWTRLANTWIRSRVEKTGTKSITDNSSNTRE